ncbi:hypothetical protein [Falsigemmobacter intermedius]|uniref:hypothetical protein n=1 Tax=Falsigemmobacter intermedius TaxID=1553448 RepID=UPI003F0634A8
MTLTTPDEIAALFTRAGDYTFARWGRPIVPVVFGVEESTLAILKGAIEAVVALAGHKMAEQDTELGANLMFFFIRDWDDLIGVPNLERLIDGLPDLVTRLKGADANQYRMFRFDDAGAIRAAFVFIRVDKDLAEVPAEDLALDQAVRIICLWGEKAFPKGTLVKAGAHTVLDPSLAAVIRAAYDPVLPAVAKDASHALRLFARAQTMGVGDAPL